MSQRTSPRRTALLSVERLEDRTTPSVTAYVGSLFTNLLHRPAHSGEFVRATDLINGGTPPGQIAADVVAGPQRGNRRTCPSG